MWHCNRALKSIIYGHLSFSFAKRIQNQAAKDMERKAKYVSEQTPCCDRTGCPVTGHSCTEDSNGKNELNKDLSKINFWV